PPWRLVRTLHHRLPQRRTGRARRRPAVADRGRMGPAARRKPAQASVLAHGLAQGTARRATLRQRCRAPAAGTRRRPHSRQRGVGRAALCEPVRSRPRPGDRVDAGRPLPARPGRRRAMTAPAFTVRAVDYEAGLPALRHVRETVFVQEQGVPLALERDELDPLCHHVVAVDADGNPVATGRLTPNHPGGRRAVLSDWRGGGVGDALLAALVDQARQRGWRELSLHAQVTALGFYARHGFLPVDERFVEAGIEHQSMRTLVDADNPVGSREAAVAAALGVIAGARRQLDLY